jgi:hypothetical protein
VHFSPAIPTSRLKLNPLDGRLSSHDFCILRPQNNRLFEGEVVVVSGDPRPSTRESGCLALPVEDEGKTVHSESAIAELKTLQRG